MGLIFTSLNTTAVHLEKRGLVLSASENVFVFVTFLVHFVMGPIDLRIIPKMSGFLTKLE